MTANEDLAAALSSTAAGDPAAQVDRLPARPGVHGRSALMDADAARLNEIADIDEAHWWLETRQLTGREQLATEFICDCGFKTILAGHPVSSVVEGRAMRLHVASLIVDAGRPKESTPHTHAIDTVEQLGAIPKWSVIVLAESGVAFQKYWEGQWRGTNGANIAADDPDLDELLPATLVSPGRPAVFIGNDERLRPRPSGRGGAASFRRRRDLFLGGI